MNYLNNQNYHNANTLRLSYAGIGNILLTAMPLILLMIKLKNVANQPNIKNIHLRAVNEISYFDKTLRQKGYAPKTILAASYCICTAFDEVILTTPYGAKSEWIQQTLLSVIHKETWGGERFYIILNKMAEDPINNLEILELIYMLLNLGFEGKYFNEHRDIRDEIKYSLFNLIRNYREPPPQYLSPSTIDQRVILYHKQHRIPLRYIGVATLGIIITMTIIFNIISFSHTAPLLNSLQHIVQER